MSIRHTMHQLPERMRARAGGVDGAVRQFLADVTAAVERGAKERVAGSGAPGGYPVPRQSTTLWRSFGVDAPRQTGNGWAAVVFNDARNDGKPYARAVHEGFHAFGNPNAPYYGPRPFLTDAAAAADPAERLQKLWGDVP